MFKSITNLFGPPSPILNEPTIDYNHTINSINLNDSTTNSSYRYSPKVYQEPQFNRSRSSSVPRDRFIPDINDSLFNKYDKQLDSDIKYDNLTSENDYSRPISEYTDRFRRIDRLKPLNEPRIVGDKPYNIDSNYEPSSRFGGSNYSINSNMGVTNKDDFSRRSPIPRVNTSRFEQPDIPKPRYQSSRFETPRYDNSMHDRPKSESNISRLEPRFEPLSRIDRIPKLDYQNSIPEKPRINSTYKDDFKIPSRYDHNPIKIYQDVPPVSVKEDYKIKQFDLKFLSELNQKVENNNKFLEKLNDLVDCKKEAEEDDDNVKYNELRSQYIKELKTYQEFYENYITMFQEFKDLKDRNRKVLTKIRLIKNTTDDNSIKLICNNILDDLRQ